MVAKNLYRKVLSLPLVVLVATLTAQLPPSQAVAVQEYHYDFDTATSPLAPGYDRVTESTGYAPGGFGWVSTDGLESRERAGSADALRRDHVQGCVPTVATFRTDVLNGSYTVTLLMGDQDYAHDQMQVKANGTVVAPNVANAEGAWTTVNFNVTVTGGALSLEFSDTGGPDICWVVNAADIVPASGSGGAQPELPRVFLDTTYSPPAGDTINVNAGDNLQTALDAAQPGDTIVLDAGATFTGNFILPDKSGSSWIYIQTSAYSSLPVPGHRVSPANAAAMPNIVSPNSDPAISTPALTPSHHYRFVGIEITTTVATTDAFNFGLANLGDGEQTSLSQVPHDITFDRTYIHGTPAGNVRRGIAPNSARTAVVDSYISDIHEVGSDSQAIGAWSAPGPFKIVNNYLEGSGENIMFGGADTKIPGLVNSDIEIRHNYFRKPLSWKQGDPSYAGIPWTIKNLFELKNAQRVLVDGNILENNWGGAGQNGFGILFTPRNQNNTNPQAVVQDVTFTHNIIRNSVNGFNISGFDDESSGSQQTKRILIKDNVVEAVERVFQLLSGITNITIDHNTAINTVSVIVLSGTPDTTNLVYRNNISSHANYGVIGDVVGVGDPAFAEYAPDAVFVKNVLAGGFPELYPAHPDNYQNPPEDLAAVRFVDLAGGDYHLAGDSPFNDLGTDGKDLGADIDAVNAATQGVLTGQ
ncbi:MAG TPA: hypothetical protein VFC19_45125 [Candidatus Limnocylindrales bacterium]|nr:hypothetical protein [Candidatus Limnocylindrales bacterium]